MKVLLLSKYSRKGASSRLRSLQYLPYLENKGINVTVSCLFDDDYLLDLYQQGERSPIKIAALYWERFKVLLTARQYDLIWIEKEIFPYLPAFAERMLVLLGKSCVVDYDDAIFHNYDLSGNLIVRQLMGKKIDKVMRQATCVIVGNDYLAERATRAGAKKVFKLPTVVDHVRYSHVEKKTVPQAVIGWIGSPSTQKYVVEIAAVLADVCKQYNAKLLLVGASPHIADQLPNCNVEVVPWSEETEAHFITQMSIGIMPLPDGPWEKGKCGYKLIQYMACGVPVIASSVGVNVEIVKGTQSGLLADNPSEWESALVELLESPEKCTQYGDAGYSAVMSTYSLQVQAPILVSLFKEIVIADNSLK